MFIQKRYLTRLIDIGNNIARLFVLLSVVLATVACSKDTDGQLREKWKFEKYVFADGTEQRVDSVFFNFMKGSTSAIIVKSDGSFFTLYGGYFLHGDSMKIIFRDVEDELYDQDKVDNEVYFKKYFNWGRRECEFKIRNLTSDILELEKKDTIMYMTKY